ncbi:hypothetical protein [Palaeococcus ferrophilus]|uniref:hypothetical protein n=1 Tax=Palaeococcus ferrophilus TaxID=83868 RepID=UPI00064E29E4|nr:hypothetical protein [Palaeococcus ferrophilus]
MVFRVIREGVPFKINLNVDDYVPTALVVGNELLGGWCENYQIKGDDCHLPSLVAGLVDVSLYFLKKIAEVTNGPMKEDYLTIISSALAPKGPEYKDEAMYWHEVMMTLGVEIGEGVLTHYVEDLGFYYSRALFLLRKSQSSDDYDVTIVFKSWGTENCPEWIKKRKEDEIVRVTITLREFVTDVIQLAEEYLEMLEARREYLNRKILVNTKLSEKLSPEDEQTVLQERISAIGLELYALKELFRRLYQTNMT